MPDPTPELAAAKRITSLEADVANLRRGMVQQLTATGRLVQQALALDTKFFQGRFLSDRQPNPQEEIGIAADILAAAGAELDKRGTGPVAGTAMTEVLRSELVAREGELAEMRRQTVALQEEHAAVVAGLMTRVEQAEESSGGLSTSSADSAAELRAERAEALGLCSELLRVIQSAPAGGDDVQITLGVLQDCLKEEGGLGTVCQAAESALVSWAEALMHALGEAKAATAGLDGLRATAGEWQRQSAQLKADLDRTRNEATKAAAESAKATAEARSTSERSGIIEREITKLQSERETLVRDVERLQVELGEQRRAAHEANMARTRDREETEVFRATARSDAEHAVAKALGEVATATQLATAAVGERDQIQGRLVNAQERLDRQDAERARANSELVVLRKELETLRVAQQQSLEAAQLAQQSVSAITAERDGLQTSLTALKKDSAAVRSEGESAVARERAAAERAERLQGERDKLVSERERALAEVGTLKRDLDQLRSERDALAERITVAAKQVETVSLDRDRAAGERERTAIELAQARKELEASRALAERTASERDGLRSRVTAADGTAEAAMRERDQARGQVANAGAERDRFRAALESAQAERTNLLRSKEEQHAQFTLRLTESSRQLGEMKQVQARLAGENDRLTNENELLRKASERGKTDVAEMARRAEAAALDRRRLEEAETRATAAENRVVESERRIQGALAERDSQLAMAINEVKRLGDTVALEKKRFADAIALLKQARGAVEDAKRATATFDAVQAELARVKKG